MLKYPLTQFNDYPFVKFVGKDGNGVGSGEITLYAPESFQVGDGANYGTFDLGVIGAGAGYGIVGEDGTFNSDSVEAKMNEMKNSNDTNKSIIMGQAFKNFGMSSGLSERALDIYKVKKGKAVNPNTVLQYSGSNIRDFSFTFVMVAKSASENAVIKEIHETFRYNMYAEGADLILDYPAKWLIGFHNSNGSVNRNYPDIKECYLVSLNTTLNPNGNGFHADGAPTEIGMTLSFRETKALTRKDLSFRGLASNNNGGSNGGFV